MTFPDFPDLYYPCSFKERGEPWWCYPMVWQGKRGGTRSGQLTWLSRGERSPLVRASAASAALAPPPRPVAPPASPGALAPHRPADEARGSAGSALALPSAQSPRRSRFVMDRRQWSSQAAWSTSSVPPRLAGRASRGMCRLSWNQHRTKLENLT